MEGDLIKINEWLLPFSWIYGIGVKVRNALFDMGILKSKSYDVPVICIGNITVGGTGKTPHTEYLIKLLSEKYKVAVLSRGYKRKSEGYVLADANTPMEMIGDEPYQMKQKFEQVYVAVDKNRRRGIERLCADKITADTDVILLDDAYQHRYVKPGVNILLVDYHRMIGEDKLLPAGRLREPSKGKDRAHIVIVTKCPADIKPMGFRVLQKALHLYPYQKLFFSTFKYGKMSQLFGSEERNLATLRLDEHILLLTGIASPEQMRMDLERYTKNITSLAFDDHHFFDEKDVALINEAFAQIKAKEKIIITTEKDATRLKNTEGLSEAVKEALFVLPIEVEIMQNQKDSFNEKILSYVLKNSRNSVLAQSKDADNSRYSHHLGNRIRKIGR
ncbi:MAG: tetraacyldisaccharide 4'-kinase [Paraprevotella sp.]|nr:tetraacyldisaccharide 4'-kinase [Paraprevotella sp.]